MYPSSSAGDSWNSDRAGSSGGVFGGGADAGKMDRISWVIAVIAWSFASAATVQPAKFPHPVGVGPFPVTFECASAWFAHHAVDNQKLVTMIVYMNGDAG